ncbi:chaB [Euproctis pseudoconspersa nucleopolyhedrovirus]|uniref:ChaB n=1 Tax=Euproctis pseudoconspersa nucleopolyhedrovirus TaxID=307467 RepID=C3TWT9_9ABAC|nr:chaB [Euproctis pseudoconspersa nucleopolyhedrovirus]ACO53481.1 chaB [Euproctis pseudoconspersa nucleopolyhedrovirus]QUJ09222.1 chaB protein [Gynaephora ruoergensis nucleopolyhedrovirus]
MSDNIYNNLPPSTRRLPFHAKRIFLKFYTKSLSMRMSKEDAIKIAWSAVKRKYYKNNNRQWVAYVDDNEFDTTTSDDDDESFNANTDIDDGYYEH